MKTFCNKLFHRSSLTNDIQDTNLPLTRNSTTPATQPKQTKGHLMILGFFNRGNIGDQAYVVPYQTLFSDYDLTFISIDDLIQIPANIDAVIVAGGDVINDYFMTKIKAALATYNGPCYAFSVGIPFADGVRYTPYFDHIVLRSRQDMDAVRDMVGSKNVEYAPDAAWMLQSVVTRKPTHHKPISHPKIPKKFAICLAQPAFYQNTYESDMIAAIVKFIYTLKHTYVNCEIHILAFNTSVYEDESDYIVNNKVFQKLQMYQGIYNHTEHALTDPIAMLNFFATMDFVVGMRYHSIVFAMIQNIPFVAIYATKKIANVLEDTNLTDFGYYLPHDENYKPTNVDVDTIMTCVRKRIDTHWTPLVVTSNHYDKLRNIVASGKRHQFMMHTFNTNGLDTTITHCGAMIMSYLNISRATYDAYVRGDVQTAAVLANTSKNTLDLAKLICFGITNKIGSPYIWGLDANMNKSDFALLPAIKWIYLDFLSVSRSALARELYYPVINPQLKVVIDINYMSQDNYEGLHRSGWSYVLGGLQHIDTRNVLKPSNVLVDTCLERTFLWGIDVTKTSGIIPYNTPWAGFIHHTFNTTYSTYNCVSLFACPEFQQSLQKCVCLFTLSDYLKTQVESALTAINFQHVPVYSVVHPTLFVNTRFDITDFAENRDRKIIQIGAWLRDSYGIYALPVPKKNDLSLSKAHLKGKEMDNYFKPAVLFDDMVSKLVNDPINTDPRNISRGGDTHPINNKYLEGMLSHIQMNDSSVHIIEHVTDEEYDKMLSENIVFLSLVDASAVNTIMECIVRTTPIIVNRHPAIEEVLGSNYPGFYDTNDMYTAVSLALDMNKLYAMHTYLESMNKEKIGLEYFVNDVQSKLFSALALCQNQSG